jgi:hypothetical protein
LSRGAACFRDGLRGSWRWCGGHRRQCGRALPPGVGHDCRRLSTSWLVWDKPNKKQAKTKASGKCGNGRYSSSGLCMWHLCESVNWKTTFPLPPKCWSLGSCQQERWDTKLWSVCFPKPPPKGRQTNKQAPTKGCCWIETVPAVEGLLSLLSLKLAESMDAQRLRWTSDGWMDGMDALAAANLPADARCSWSCSWSWIRSWTELMTKGD